MVNSRTRPTTKLLVQCVHPQQKIFFMKLLPPSRVRVCVRQAHDTSAASGTYVYFSDAESTCKGGGRYLMYIRSERLQCVRRKSRTYVSTRNSRV